jgi:hypothetical protein
VATIRLLPAHQVVQRTYPRPPATEQDDVARAVGTAIDGALAQAGYEVRLGRRPTATSLAIAAERILDRALEENVAEVTAAEREKILVQIRGVIQAYRKSPIFGLSRPKTRIVVIRQEVGVYAQPDYWDGRQRFFEMKSYAAYPMRPDVALQMRLFQLAFPGFEAHLVSLNRHASPVEVLSTIIAPPTPPETEATLRLAYAVALEHGEEKVLEYVEGPFVYYDLPPAPT